MSDYWAASGPASRPTSPQLQEPLSTFMTNSNGQTQTFDNTLSYMETAMTEVPEAELVAPPSTGNLEKQPEGRARRTPQLLKSALTAALLLLIAAGGFSAARRLVKKEEPKALEASTEEMLAEMDRRFTQLQDDWSNASEDVKKAFAATYCPSVEGIEMAPSDVLGLYMRHVEAVRHIRPPPATDEAQMQAYSRHVQLVTGVVAAASERLSGLRGLEQIHAETGVAVNLLKKPDREPLPPLDQLEQPNQDFLQFEEFLATMVPTDLTAGMNFQGGTGKVPKVLLMKLSTIMRLEERAKDEDFAVQSIFKQFFMDSYGISAHKLRREDTEGMEPFKVPADRMFFNSQAFARFLGARMTSSLQPFVSKQELESCKKDFTTEKMLQVLQDLKQKHDELPKEILFEKRFAMQQARFGPPPSPAHLMSLALFLV